jgi:hypothetical protein
MSDVTLTTTPAPMACCAPATTLVTAEGQATSS